MPPGFHCIMQVCYCLAGKLNREFCVSIHDEATDAKQVMRKSVPSASRVIKQAPRYPPLSSLSNS